MHDDIIFWAILFATPAILVLLVAWIIAQREMVEQMNEMDRLMLQAFLRAREEKRQHNMELLRVFGEPMPKEEKPNE